MFDTIAVIAVRARAQHQPQYSVADPHRWQARLRECPHLAPLIQDVMIGVSSDGDRQPRTDVLYQFMIQVAPTLPNLRALTVFGYNTAISTHRTFVPQMRKLQLPGITTLSVKHVVVEDTNQFGLWFLFPFPRLVDLQLQDVAWRRMPGKFVPDATTKGRGLPQITRLSLCYGPPLRRSESSGPDGLETRGVWTLRWILSLLCRTLVKLDIDCAQYDELVPSAREMERLAADFKDCPTARIRPPWYTTPNLKQLDLHIRFAMRVRRTKGGVYIAHVPVGKARGLLNQWHDGEGIDTLRSPEHLARIADVLEGFDAPRLDQFHIAISRGDWITFPDIDGGNEWKIYKSFGSFGREKERQPREAREHLLWLGLLDQSLLSLLLRPEGGPFPALKKITLDPNFYPDVRESRRLHRLFTEGLPLLVEEGLLEIAPCREDPPFLGPAGPGL
ncbi:hypothetical protein GY45DRAFT_1363530 [Cubamyces sp. BRFM 1775]|nr:hypothetical protein GY45DRAFT_1363530 [Cubamyces sp. BRFM 1775]